MDMNPINPGFNYMQKGNGPRGDSMKGITVFGAFNIVLGLIQLFMFLILQGAIFYALLGLLYLISAFGILILNSKIRKIFLYAIVPLSILASLHIIGLSNKGMPDYYYTSLKEGSAIIAITILLPLIYNVYFLTCLKVKKQFEGNGTSEKREGGV